LILRLWPCASLISADQAPASRNKADLLTIGICPDEAFIIEIAVLLIPTPRGLSEIGKPGRFLGAILGGRRAKKSSLNLRLEVPRIELLPGMRLQFVFKGRDAYLIPALAQ
jgi:hypothetical protein